MKMRGERWMLWFGASREGAFALFWHRRQEMQLEHLEVAARQEIIEKNLLETDCFSKTLNFRTSLLSLLL